MTKLYRLVWDNPKTDKKNSTWWMPSMEACAADKDRIETEYGVKCELEEKEF